MCSQVFQTQVPREQDPSWGLQSRCLDIPNSGGGATPTTRVHVRIAGAEAKQLNSLSAEKGSHLAPDLVQNYFYKIQRHPSGLERRLGSYKYCMLFQRTRVPFPAPTRWLRAVLNSSSRDLTQSSGLCLLQ